MSERTLDARGKPCPQPVVETRRILLEESPALLRVIVDNDAAGENVTRLARSLGRTARAGRRSGREIHLLIAAPSGGAAESESRGIAAADREEAATKGVRLLSCGTCLDFHRLKDRLAVGEVTNMFEVVSLPTAADRVIRP